MSEKELYRLAFQGNRDAQRAIEEAMGLPEGAVAGRIASIKEMEQKAKGGDTFAMAQYGRELFAGMFLDQDFKEAAFWLKKAADDGWRVAMFYLGEIYTKKEEFEGWDYYKALYYMGKALAEGPDADGFIGGVIRYESAKDFYEHIEKRRDRDR